MVMEHKEALENLLEVLQDSHWEVTNSADEERINEAMANAIDSVSGKTQIDREIEAMEAALEAKRQERDRMSGAK